jgi:hypothetical protein
MEVLENELYDDYAAEFQFEMIKILNETLKKHNIPIETRKEICGDFTFDFSMLIDQGEISNTLPRVTFYKEDEDVLHFGSLTFDFHDYAFGNTDAVFEEEDEQPK